eukprot:scaffold12532_cov48-Phaeocystis_antarctica.AAC.3
MAAATPRCRRRWRRPSARRHWWHWASYHVSLTHMVWFSQTHMGQGGVGPGVGRGHANLLCTVSVYAVRSK